MEDETILRMLAERDEAALKALEDRFGAYCLAIAGNILGRAEDAEECVNDVWLKLWRSIPPATPRDLRAYVAKTARSTAIDRYKSLTAEKRGGGTAPVLLEELSEVLPDREGPEEAYLNEELKAGVNAFLRALEPRDCDVFILRYFYAESTPSIAGRFGVKEAHVRLILSRTRKKLRAYLKKEGFIYE